MANPQIENGHTKIANEILEQLMKLHLSSNQWQVILCIIRKTYGFHKKVDYIANSQIVEATGLCKAVVSRSLKTMEEMNLINRQGKFIGFQKDWERWQKLAKLLTKVSNTANNQKLAEQSTLDVKLAEQSTIEKLAIQQQKLAILSTELAESSTKVSSHAVAQKIKDTITKETIQKKETVSFEDYKLQLQERFSDLDFNSEYEKFNLYWNDGHRKMKNPKLALLNWLTKARNYQKGDSNGKFGKTHHSRELPRDYNADQYPVYPDSIPEN